MAEQATRAFTPPAELTPANSPGSSKQRTTDAGKLSRPSSATVPGPSLPPHLGRPSRGTRFRQRHQELEATHAGLTRAWAEQAADLLREIRGQPVPGEARAALQEIMAGVSELSDEATLLAVVPSDAPLRVPDGSRTGTSAWTVPRRSSRSAVWAASRRPLRRSPMLASELASME